MYPDPGIERLPRFPWPWDVYASAVQNCTASYPSRPAGSDFLRPPLSQGLLPEFPFLLRLHVRPGRKGLGYAGLRFFRVAGA
jgi:hypothetical protein